MRAATAGVSLPVARSTEAAGTPSGAPATRQGVPSKGSTPVTHRARDWTAPPPWVGNGGVGEAPSRPTGVGAVPDGAAALTSPAGEDGPHHDASQPARRGMTLVTRRSRATGGGAQVGGADRLPPADAPVAAAAAAGGDASDPPRTSRGFAYDLIAEDPAFTPGDGSHETGPALPIAPAAYQATPAPPPLIDPVARAEAVDHTRWRAEQGSPMDTAPALPRPDHLPPPARRPAPPAPRPSRGDPFQAGREWERPRRFDAYPALRTRVSVGMPGIPRVGRLPRVVIGAIALLLAAVILFALPGLFAGRPGGGGGGGGGGGATSRPSQPPAETGTATAEPTTAAPPTPQVYLVKSGDTLSRIAKQFGFTIAQILSANPDIKDRNALKIGQRIVIPTAEASPSPGTGTGETPSESPGGSPGGSP